MDGLAYTLWRPAGEIAGGVVVLHGAGSSKERHHPFARACKAGPRGDRPRSPRSRGERGFARRARGGRRPDRGRPPPRRRPARAARLEHGRLPRARGGRPRRRGRRRGDLPGLGDGTAARPARGPLRLPRRRGRPVGLPGRARRDPGDGRPRDPRSSCCTPRATTACRSPTRASSPRAFAPSARGWSRRRAAITGRSSTTPSCRPRRCGSWPGSAARTAPRRAPAPARAAGGPAARSPRRPRTARPRRTPTSRAGTWPGPRGAKHCDQDRDADRHPDLAHRVDDRRPGGERLRGQRPGRGAINVGSVRPTPTPVAACRTSTSPT